MTPLKPVSETIPASHTSNKQSDEGLVFLLFCWRFGDRGTGGQCDQ